jgi:hypothetical protein
VQWRKLRSRAIRLIGHDFDTHRLVVRFDGGMFYAYEGVSDDVLTAFAQADIPGQLIRDQLTPRSYSDKTRGHSSLDEVLSQAAGLGLHSISRSPRELESRSIDGLDAAGVAALSEQLDIDEDCVGNHTWFILGSAPGSARLLWHLNETTGAVVPPHPRVLRTTAVARRRAPRKAK